MVDQRLVEYLKNYISQGYTRDQLTAHLAGQGWSRKDLDEAFDAFLPKKQIIPTAMYQAEVKKPETAVKEHKEMSHFVPVAVLACVFLIIGVFFYSYFYVINPTFVSKPVLVKPEMPSVGAAITSSQVEYMLNELDVYKLHGNPVG